MHHVYTSAYPCVNLAPVSGCRLHHVTLYSRVLETGTYRGRSRINPMIHHPEVITMFVGGIFSIPKLDKWSTLWFLPPTFWTLGSENVDTPHDWKNTVPKTMRFTSKAELQVLDLALQIPTGRQFIDWGFGEWGYDNYDHGCEVCYKAEDFHWLIDCVHIFTHTYICV